MQFVIVVDDENNQVEGNLIMAASLANPQAIAFMVKNGSGIVSVGMKEEDLKRLKLPLMTHEDNKSQAPSFTITVVYNFWRICFVLIECCLDDLKAVDLSSGC